MDTEVKRLPRPYGLTSLVQEYQHSGDPELLGRIQALVIQQWVTQGGYICGKVLNIQALAIFVGLSLGHVQGLLSQGFLQSPLWDKSLSEQVASNLVGTAMAWALEDRIDAAGQLGILQVAQGGIYKPYISAEVNRALAHKASTTRGLLDVLKSFAGGNNTQVNIFNNGGDAQASQNAITQEAALALIQQELKTLPMAETAMGCIEATEGFEDLPEVVANKQEGDFSKKEGLGLNKLTVKTSTDGYKEAIRAFDKDFHEVRREVEEAVVVDDDPELEIYK